MKNYLLIPLLLAGCSLSPDYTRPDLSLPGSWQNQIGEQQVVQNFWAGFNDPQLEKLVAQALAANQDLAAGAARVEQARAVAQIADSDLYPQLSAGADLNRSFANPVTGGQRGAANDSRATLSLSYEVDFWGRIRDGANAADARALGSEYDYKTLALITAADTASNYIRYLADSARLTVAENTRRDVADTARLTEARYQAGVLSSVESNQQKIQLANQDAAIAALRAQVNADLTALAILTGVPAGTLKLDAAPFDRLQPSLITIRKPSELLDRRPDILSAEQQLRASNYDIGVVRASFLPSLSIGADAGLIGLLPDDTMSSTLQLGASVLQPIFTGGALTGQLNQANAARAEQTATYRQTVLTATKEVEDAIAYLNSDITRAEAFGCARDASQAAFGAIRARYDVGSIDQLTLLQAERDLFSSQDSAISARADQLTSLITLWRTTGGTQDFGLENKSR